MFTRVIPLAVVCAMLPLGMAPLAAAEPEPAPAPPLAAGAVPPPPPPSGPLPVPSSPPGVLATPDGWTLTVAGSDETMEAVAPLTTALSSREYLVGGDFRGAISGGGDTTLTGGVLEAGYQIGCGIVGGPVELTGSLQFSPSIAIPIPSTFNPAFGNSISGQIKIGLRPGTVTIVPVGKKEFKGTAPRVSIAAFRVKVDGCVGQSFIRSYATLTSSTDNTDDVVTYLGQTKVV